MQIHHQPYPAMLAGKHGHELTVGSQRGPTKVLTIMIHNDLAYTAFTASQFSCLNHLLAGRSGRFPEPSCLHEFIQVFHTNDLRFQQLLLEQGAVSSAICVVFHITCQNCLEGGWSKLVITAYLRDWTLMCQLFWCWQGCQSFYPWPCAYEGL